MTDMTTGASMDTAPPTDGHTASAGVLLAQADPAADTQTPAPTGDAIVLAPPLPGETREEFVVPGQAYTVDADPDRVSMSQDGGNLVLSFDGGGSVVLSDFLTFAAPDSGALPPALTLADGTVISPEMLVADYGVDLNDLAPAAGTPAAGTPAAPGDGGAGGGGAGFGIYGIGAIGEGINPLDLLGNLDFGFDFVFEDEEVGGDEDTPGTPVLAAAAVTEPEAEPQPEPEPEPIVGVMVDEDGLEQNEYQVGDDWYYNPHAGIPGGPDDMPGEATEMSGSLPDVGPGDGLTFLLAGLPQLSLHDGTPLEWQSLPNGGVVAGYFEAMPYNSKATYAPTIQDVQNPPQQQEPQFVPVLMIEPTGEADSDYQVTLFQALEHSQPGTEDDINIPVRYQTADGSTGTVIVGVDDDTPEPKAVTVTNWGAEAGNDNSIGWYVLDEVTLGDDDAVAGTGYVIWKNASNANEGESFTIEGYSEDEIGFFLIRDGADKGAPEGAADGNTDGEVSFSASGLTFFFDNDDLNVDKPYAQTSPDPENGEQDDYIPADVEGTRYYFRDDGVQQDNDFDDAQITVKDATVGARSDSDNYSVLSEPNPGDVAPYTEGEDSTYQSHLFGSDVHNWFTGYVGDPIADYGADGPEPHPTNPAMPTVFSFADGLESTEINLKGWNDSAGQYEDITLEYVEPSNDYSQILKGVTVGGQDVFAIRLYNDGWYDVSLLGAVQHTDEQSGGPDGDLAALNIPGAIQTYDDDGDPVALDFNIVIRDGGDDDSIEPPQNGLPVAYNDVLNPINDIEFVEGGVSPPNDGHYVQPLDDGFMTVFKGFTADNEGIFDNDVPGSDGVDWETGVTVLSQNIGTVEYNDSTQSFEWTIDDPAAAEDLDGPPSFEYEIEDGNGDTDTATVTLDLPDLPPTEEGAGGDAFQGPA